MALPEAARGEVNGGYEVLILDLSLGGARLAHTDILPPRGPISLRFTLNDSVIVLTARTAWSCAVGRAADGVVLYESGLAFNKGPAAARASLRAFLEGSPLPVAMPASVEPAEGQSEKPRERPRGSMGAGEG
jgi:hypothetical protein